MKQLGRRLLSCFGLLLLAVGLFGCDHATKAAAQSALAGGKTVSIVGDAVTLHYVPNDDVAFSAFHHAGLATQATPTILAALAAGAMVLMLAAWWRSRKEGALVNAGFAAAFAGALGNIVDRIMHGYVVDFIHVKRWPVFNVADILVVLGIAVAFVRVQARTRTQRRTLR